MSIKNTLTPTYVITSNDLIRAKYNYTLWEKRIFIYMISHLKREDREFRPMKLYIRDLMKFFGVSSNNDYHIIRNIPDTLAKKPFYVPFVSKEGTKKWAVINILSYGIQPDESEPETDSAFIELKFNTDLLPYLLELKDKFTKYNIRNVTELQSVYSIRMFELMKENEYRRDGFEITLDELKDILFMKAKDNNGRELYPLYADFKKRVLLKSQQDLSEHCDISFDFEEIKDGKKVVAIYFRTKINNSTAAKKNRAADADPSVSTASWNTTPENKQLFEDVFTIVNAWGIGAEVLQLLIETQPAEALRNGLEYTIKEEKSGKIKENIGGFFITAVKNRFTNAQFEAEKKRAQTVKANQKRAVELKRLQSDMQDLKDSYQAAIYDMVRLITDNQSDALQRAIEGVKTDNKGYFALKGVNPDALTTDNFREDKILRGMVITQIQLQNPEAFAPITRKYQPKIREIEDKIRQLT